MSEIQRFPLAAIVSLVHDRYYTSLDNLYRLIEFVSGCSRRHPNPEATRYTTDHLRMQFLDMLEVTVPPLTTDAELEAWIAEHLAPIFGSHPEVRSHPDGF